MKIFFLASLISTSALSSDHVVLPPEGASSAERILHCEYQLEKIKNIQKAEDTFTKSYTQINPGADSFIYFFTIPSEPAHPAMIKITLHAKLSPTKVQESEIEFYESYASTEESYLAWRKRILFDFGRGYASNAHQSVKEDSREDIQ